MASSFKETAGGNQVEGDLDVLNTHDQNNAKVLEEPNWCCEVLSSLLQDPSTHDVTFVTSDGGSVSGNKAILTASSPVFRAMFNDNVHTSGKMEIPLPSVDAETLFSLVSYIYTGKVVVNSATSLDILIAAMHFKIISLVTNLIIFATVSLDTSNVISVAIFACERNFCQLLDNCLKYMCANASDVVHHSDFIKLPHEVVLAFCKSSDLNVSEIDLFLAVNKWQQYNQKVTKATIKNIFREIRYPLISNNDLVRKVAPTEMADQSLYIAALEYHIDANLYRGPLNQLVTRKCLEVTSPNSNTSEAECPTGPENSTMCGASSSNLVGTKNRTSTEKLHLVVKSVSSVPWSVADEEPVTPNKLLDTEGRIVANSCSKLDKVVEARINGGMVPSDRASPDTTISILSDEHIDSTIPSTPQGSRCVMATTLETESYCNANDDKFMEEEEHSTEEEAENSTEPNDLLPTVVDEYTEVLQTEVNEHEPKKRGCKRRQIENENGQLTTVSTKRTKRSKENQQKKKSKKDDVDMNIRVGKPPLRTIPPNTIVPYDRQPIELYSSDEETDQFLRCCAIVEEGFGQVDGADSVVIQQSDPPVNYSSSAKELELETNIKMLTKTVRDNEEKQNKICDELRSGITLINTKFNESQKVMSKILAQLISPRRYQPNGLAPSPCADSNVVIDGTSNVTISESMSATNVTVPNLIDTSSNSTVAVTTPTSSSMDVSSSSIHTFSLDDNSQSDHFPGNFETVEASSGMLDTADILYIKEKSCSRKNFAARLNVALFDLETRKKSNVAGQLSKLKLNPVLIEYIQSIVFQHWPRKETEGTVEEEWRACVIAIDEINRRLNHKPKKQKKQLKN